MSKPAGLPKTITGISYSFLYLLILVEYGFDIGSKVFVFGILTSLDLLRLENAEKISSWR
jgi:hypothetical protein